MDQGRARRDRDQEMATRDAELTAPATRRGRKKRSTPMPWYRHLSILISIGACVAFAVLIGGTVVIRTVILRIQPPPQNDASIPNVEPPVASEPVPSKVSNPVASISEEPKKEDTVPEVLPALADSKPGGKLARMLLVGPGKDMFPTISAAIKSAAPGDIIEVRTNGPLLELGTELKSKTRRKGVPLTIRGANGFRPVVRVKSPLILSENIDVLVSGMHFVSNGSANLLWVNDGNVSVQDCSLSCIQTRPGQLMVLYHIASRDTAEQFQVSFERCFLRESSFGSLVSGRSAFVAKDCGYIGIHGSVLINCELAENNSAAFEKCTFIRAWMMTATVREPTQWTTPFTCRVSNSILGHLLVPPRAIQISSSPSFQPTNAATAMNGVTRLFKLEGSHSVRQLDLNTSGDPRMPDLLQSWVGVGGMHLKFPIAPTIPTLDSSIRFGEGIERVRFLTGPGGDLPSARALCRSLLPDQLLVTSTGPLADLRNGGIVVGCDVSLLPVPPPITLEPFLFPN